MWNLFSSIVIEPNNWSWASSLSVPPLRSQLLAFPFEESKLSIFFRDQMGPDLGALQHKRGERLGGNGGLGIAERGQVALWWADELEETREIGRDCRVSVDICSGGERGGSQRDQVGEGGQERGQSSGWLGGDICSGRDRRELGLGFPSYNFLGGERDWNLKFESWVREKKRKQFGPGR